MSESQWQRLTYAYARVRGINYYHASADVIIRRLRNGEREAWRWFARVILGESLSWNERG